MIERPTDEQLFTILAFADDVDCVDEDDIDHAELLSLGRGQLAAERHPAVEAHLDRCVACRHMLEAYGGPAAEPELEDVAMGSAASAPSPYVWVSAIAAAVVVFFAANGLDRPPGPDYAVVEVKGVVAEQMGEAPPPSDALTVATSTNLRLIIRPAEPFRLGPEATAGVFVETPQGTYRRAPAEVEALREGGAVAFRIRVSGEALLEGRGTRDRIAIVVATSAAALDAMEGSVTFEPGYDGVVDVITRSVDPR